MQPVAQVYLLFPRRTACSLSAPPVPYACPRENGEKPRPVESRQER